MLEIPEGITHLLFMQIVQAVIPTFSYLIREGGMKYLPEEHDDTT